MPSQSERPAADVFAALGEAELVARAQKGDRDAFREIVRRGNQRLFRIARSVLRDDSDAEDVMQDAYARAFAAIGSFKMEASVLTWLTRITLNEAYQRLRRRREYAGLDEVEAAQEEARVLAFPTGQPIDDPEIAAGRSQARRMIERAVDALPEPFRLVFILREIEDCSTDETAAALGLKEETVKTRLHRARRLLRRTLDKEIASTLNEAFSFRGADCARVTATVLARLAAVQAGTIADSSVDRGEGGGSAA